MLNYANIHSNGDSLALQKRVDLETSRLFALLKGESSFQKRLNGRVNSVNHHSHMDKIFRDFFGIS